RGKRVRFEGDVGDFGLDRQVLDGLRDPMVHLLRNAVDHGIEAPEERESRGKAPIGTVSVRARTMGSMVEIDITDDGRGVDRQAVIARAIERGLLSPERAAKISEAEVLDLLFSPGFSTAGAVSRISGRGVGLDVVRTRVQELGGRAEIGENPGGGTLFRLTVPSSLVSTKGLLVKTGSTVHALPIAYVERTLRVALEDVRSVEGGAAVEQEGSEPLRLRWLATLMAESRQDDPERLAVVVVEHGRQRRGLVVGDVLGEAEFVVRQLPWNIRRLRGIAGAAVLGDGGLAVVIDVPSLFEGAASGRLAATETVKRKSEARKQRILVVDDSLTSRMLERNILLATGYDVEVANDGEEGWEALQRQEVDLLITDVEMPRLDGIELTRRVRADARLRELPIIMVTSLSRPEDVKAGAAAGADEYIVKGRFDHRALLDAVNRLI
ncbi:MAG: response regulator, partial [Myxococcales bacterium]|nr:response regulator [Myxococcales bacterium]